MLKGLFRLSSIFLLSALLVYAPEILSSICPPYSLSPPQRTLLRIALCSDDPPDSLDTVIAAYQKRHPHVHLRITRLNEEQLPAMPRPYPDVLLYTASAFSLPEGFSPPQAHTAPLHAAAAVHPSSREAGQFAAYINEAFAAQAGNL